jgi:hypothetical protein
MVYRDGTYAIGYGVEHRSSLQKNFYHIDTNNNITNVPYFMQVVGTAQYVGTPSIGEVGGLTPANAAATPYTSSKVTLAPGGASMTEDTPSVINTGSSGILSTGGNTSGGGGGVPVG